MKDDDFLGPLNPKDIGFTDIMGGLLIIAFVAWVVDVLGRLG